MRCIGFYGSVKTACLGKRCFSIYMQKSSQPVKLLGFWIFKTLKTIGGIKLFFIKVKNLSSHFRRGKACSDMPKNVQNFENLSFSQVSWESIKLELL